MDRFIRRVVASADAVGARRRSDKQITVSFDEWNVWYLESRFPGESNLPIQRDAPRIIEDVYSGLDAVVVGDLLVTLLNHADRVPVACLAQLVNVIAPIMTEPGGEAWRQPTFHPFATTARLAHGAALDLRVDAPSYATARHGEVPLVTAAATVDDDGALALFLTNRGDDVVEVEVSHAGAIVTLEQGRQMVADHEPAVAGAQHAAKVEEACWSAVDVARAVAPGGGSTTIRLAPESWTAFEGRLAHA